MGDDECPPEFANDDRDWHLLSGGHRSGPYRFSELAGAVDNRIVKSSDLVWHPRWSDWRQVKSVRPLACMSAAEFSDCEYPAGAGRVSPLVSAFELKLRPGSTWPAWLERIILDDRFVHTVNLISIALTIAVLAGLSVLIFDNDRYGVAYIAIEFTTLLLICIGFSRRAQMRDFSAFRFCALSVLSALLLAVMNIGKLPDALDAWQGRRLLAPARTTEQVQRAALKAPENKFVQLVMASLDAAQQTSAATAQLIKNLEPQGLTFDGVRAASTRDRLTENAAELRAAEARAALALPHYVAILESERARVAQAGRKIYAGDPHHLLPGFLEALGRRENQFRERMGRTFAAIGAYYGAMGDAAEFVAQHWDQYRTARVSKVSFAAADQGTNAQYTRLMANMRAAQAAMTGLERDNRKFSSDLKVLWTEAGKAR